MRTYVKKFKVVDLSHRVSDDTHYLTLIGEDGEGWKVKVDAAPRWSDLWRYSVIYEFPLVVQVNGDDRSVIPDFSLWGDDSPERIEFECPCELLRKYWGHDAVIKHMPCDTPRVPPQPMDDVPPVVPEPSRPRKRRKTKPKEPPPPTASAGE